MILRSHSTLIRFGIVGVFNTLLGLSIIYILKRLFGTGDVAANIIGYIVGLIASFFLNRKWTFRFQGAGISTFAKFSSVVLLAYLMNLATVLIARDVFHLNAYLAQAIGVPPYTGFTYIAFKYFVFAAPRPVEA